MDPEPGHTGSRGIVEISTGELPPGFRGTHPTTTRTRYSSSPRASPLLLYRTAFCREIQVRSKLNLFAKRCRTNS